MVSAAKRPKAALVFPSDSVMLSAFMQAIQEGLIDGVIVGNEKEFAATAAGKAIDDSDVTVLPAETLSAAVSTALQMAASGQIDLFVCGGATEIGEFVRLLPDGGASFAAKGKTLSHIAVIKPALYHKILLLTDGRVTTQPDLSQKIGILQNAIDFGAHLGVISPRVAVLAAVEVIYPQMPVTTEAAVLSKMADRGQIKGALVEGPISFDCAVDEFAAQSKGLKKSPVAGQADILLAPNAATADGVYRAMALFGQAQTGGILFGGAVPVAISIPTDSAETRFHSIVLAVLATQSPV